RLLRQAQGRAARQGLSGTSEIIASLESDPFFKSVPDPVRDTFGRVFERYGNGSPELGAALDFIQRATHIGHSIERRSMVMKDRQMTALQDRYGEVVASAVRELESSPEFPRRRFNLFGMVTLGLDREPGISGEWTKKLEQMSALVHHHRIFDAAPAGVAASD